MTDSKQKTITYLQQQLDILQKGLNILVNTSHQYKNEIDNAKTKIKRDYFGKKLKRNNQELAQIIQQLDTYTKLLARTKLEANTEVVSRTSEEVENDKPE